MRKEKITNTNLLQEKEELISIGLESSQAPLVSFLSEIPAPLQAAMTSFIEDHPNWDQYRLVQAALSGFLAQNGVETREITRIYLKNMFSKKSEGNLL